jgi:hypothetical protein
MPGQAAKVMNENRLRTPRLQACKHGLGARVGLHANKESRVVDPDLRKVEGLVQRIHQPRACELLDQHLHGLAG